MAKDSKETGGALKVLEVNGYLNSVPNLAKLSGKSLKQFKEVVLGVEQQSYHNLRLGLPGDGDVVVWNEYFECREALGKQRKEVKFSGDSLPKSKKCIITSVVVLDCFDDAYKPFSRIKSGGLYKNDVHVKISSKPFVGFAVRVVITAKLK